jgi:hypothetical protein
MILSDAKGRRHYRGREVSDSLHPYRKLQNQSEGANVNGTYPT